MSSEQKADPLELYKVALATRNLEIRLFWQRSNYFLVLNTAIGTGFFAVRSDEFAYLLGALGLMSAWLWWRVNLGSKFWQSRWEHRLHVIEAQIALGRELGPGDDVKKLEGFGLFGAGWEIVKSDVAESFRDPFREPGWFARRYVKAVLKKPSVTRTMTILSVAFACFWFIALVGLVVRDYWH